MLLLHLVAPLSFLKIGIPYIEDRDVGGNNHPPIGAPLTNQCQLTLRYPDANPPNCGRTGPYDAH